MQAASVPSHFVTLRRSLRAQGITPKLGLVDTTLTHRQQAIWMGQTDATSPIRVRFPLLLGCPHLFDIAQYPAGSMKLVPIALNEAEAAAMALENAFGRSTRQDELFAVDGAQVENRDVGSVFRDTEKGIIVAKTRYGFDLTIDSPDITKAAAYLPLVMDQLDAEIAGEYHGQFKLVGVITQGEEVHQVRVRFHFDSGNVDERLFRLWEPETNQ